MNEYMQLALNLAAEWCGCTTPNPLVGAVVVKDGVVVGTGAHRRAGEPHAEVHALNMAGAKANGSTLYVTLEPCSHYGKTPPCTERIIASGVKKVVAAMIDPNPLVAGSGFQRLRAAGIEVEVGMGEAEARRLNEVFIKYITTRTPFVILKSAISLDGKIATSTGDSKWITNEEAREYVHVLRNQVDAIVVGKGTLLQDNPRLNVRLSDKQFDKLGLHELHEPQKIILTTEFDLSITELQQMAVYQFSQRKPLLLVTSTDFSKESQLQELRNIGVQVLRITCKPDGLDLSELLKKLGEMGITSLLLEGGSRIYTSFVKADLVDKVYLFQAPILIGEDGVSWIKELSTTKIHEALRLHDVEYRLYGDNSLIIGYLSTDGQANSSIYYK